MNHLELRQRTISMLARRMDRAYESAGRSMRYASDAMPAELQVGQSTAELADALLAAYRGRPLDASKASSVALDSSLMDEWWDPDARLLINEIDPGRPGALVLAVRHEDFIERIPDPLLGFMVHVHIRPLYSGEPAIERIAFSEDYFEPMDAPSLGMGRLMLHVADAGDLPVLGRAIHPIDGGPGWSWETDSAITPETAEPVMLLRINVRGSPVR